MLSVQKPMLLVIVIVQHKQAAHLSKEPARPSCPQRHMATPQAESKGQQRVQTSLYTAGFVERAFRRPLKCMQTSWWNQVSTAGCCLASRTQLGLLAPSTLPSLLLQREPSPCTPAS